MTGGKRFVFPALGERDRPMCENAVNLALRRMGFDQGRMTAHGFRAMASALLNKSGRWSPEAIERALAHKDADRVRAAYHCGGHWNEPVAMAQWLSDHGGGAIIWTRYGTGHASCHCALANIDERRREPRPRSCWPPRR